MLPVKVKGDKVSRAHAVSPLVESGKVWLPSVGAWVGEFIDELCAFPAGAHDDQVDAFVMGLDWLKDSWSARDSRMLAETVEMLNQHRRRQGPPTFDSVGSPFWGKRASSDSCEEQDRIDDIGGPNCSGWGPGPTWRRESRRGLLGLPRGRVTW